MTSVPLRKKGTGWSCKKELKMMWAVRLRIRKVPTTTLSPAQKVSGLSRGQSGWRVVIHPPTSNAKLGKRCSYPPASVLCLSISTSGVDFYVPRIVALRLIGGFVFMMHRFWHCYKLGARITFKCQLSYPLGKIVVRNLTRYWEQFCQETQKIFFFLI
jgi:hypothetical protein